MNFRKIEFDGIFLDRIRFPSFTIGKEALFTCCCSECMKAYETRGWKKDRIINTKYSVERGGGKGLPLGIIKYMKGRYEFENVDIAEYLEIRMGLITEIVKRAATYFKQQGLEVGLDLFTPFLAPLVGQDYREVSRYADFVKPMVYRCTYTPAGIDYELDEAAKNISLDGAFEKCADQYRKIIGYNRNNSADFMRRELETANQLSDCKVLAGIEIHTLDSLPAIKPEQIEEGVKTAKKAGVDGRIASWNILQADERNLSAFLEEV